MPEKLIIQFGNRVKRLRINKGLSQEELAYLADLHRTQISLIERGKRCPRLDTIFKLAKALEVNPIKLIKNLGS